MRHTARIELANNDELVLANAGIMPPEHVKRITVEDALVDTGATRLGLPPSLIEQLGLTPFRSEPVRNSQRHHRVMDLFNRSNLHSWNVKVSLPSWVFLKARLSLSDTSY